MSYKPVADEEIEWYVVNGLIKSTRVEIQLQRANALVKALLDHGVFPYTIEQALDAYLGEEP